MILVSSPVFASTHQITSGMSSNEIQNKIDSSKSGDTINFTSGGSWVNINLKIDKKLNIIGNGAKVTQNNSNAVFDLSLANKKNSASISIQGFSVNAKSTIKSANTNQVIVKNMNITGSYNNGNGIDINNANSVLIENVIINNSKNGINILNSSNATISSCSISNSVYAVYISQNSKDISISKNNFEKNKYGLFFGGVKQVHMIYNFVTNNSHCGVVISKSASDLNIDTNAFRNNSISIFIQGNLRSNSLSRNITVNNNCLNNSDTGIFLKDIHDNDLYKDIQGFSTNRYGGTDNPVLKSIKLTGDVKLDFKSNLSKKTAKRGNQLTYTITIKNYGNLKSGALSVNTGLSSSNFKSTLVYKSKGSISKNTWKINSLNPGETATLLLKTTIKTSKNVKIISKLNGPEDEIKINTKSINLKIK